MATYVNLTAAPERLTQELGLFTEAKLSLRPIHKEILNRWQFVQGSLSDTNTELDDAKRAVIIARAHRDDQRFEMQNGLRVFALDILEIVQGNRKSVTYLSYFEKGYGIFGRMNLESLLEVAHSLFMRLDEETDDAVKAAGEKLRATTAIAEAFHADWLAKKQRVTDLRSKLHTAKIAWRSGYRRVEGELRALHPDEPRYVSSFFLTAGSKKNRSVDEEIVDETVGDDGVVEAGAAGDSADSEEAFGDDRSADPAAA